MKYFFRALRLLLQPFMLLWSWLGTPRGMQRAPQAQQAVDHACAQLALYHFKTCPFCIKVRHEMARLALRVELRDAQHEGPFRDELLRDGGKIQTPCLRIAEDQGAVRWLYESGDIIKYLQGRFA